MSRIKRNNPSEEEMRRAMKTARSGPFARKALVPRHVLFIAVPKDRILDYGAGKAALHTLMLREAGLNVTAYDFPGNRAPGLHDPEALSRQYDIVYASNVLNTQGSPEMLAQTLMQLRDALAPGGVLVANYPVSPRYLPKLTPQELAQALKEFGLTSLAMVGGTRQAPVWEARRA